MQDISGLKQFIGDSKTGSVNLEVKTLNVLIEKMEQMHTLIIDLESTIKMTHRSSEAMLEQCKNERNRLGC